MPEKLIAYNQLCKAEYNRPINRAHVSNIKNHFCPDMVQPAIVSFRDGKYWIIDHQHQTQAIYEMNDSDPNTQIRCDVRNGMTYQQEAELYYRLNTSTKKLTLADKLIGLIEAGDPNAIEFRNVVEGCGYVLGSSLAAINKAWQIFNRANGARRLAEILTITNTCWPGRAKGVQAQIIDGLAAFLRNHPDYKQPQLIKALSMMEPEELIQRSSTYYRQMDSKAFTKQYCTYVIIVNSYNKGLRNSSKLVPATPVL